MQPTQTHNQHQNIKPSDAITDDHRALEGKATLMKGSRPGRMLNVIGTTLMMAGAPLFATGLIEFAKTFAKSEAAGFFAKLAATAALPAVEGALTLMAVGAVVATAAIAVNFIAQSKWQSTSIDTNEYNAQMTARHMVKGLQEKGIVITSREAAANQPVYNQPPREAANQPVYNNPPRTDGKSWVQGVADTRGFELNH